MELAYTASLNLIALPLLATLPAASASRRELANGSLRVILFRCGMPRYLMSRAVSLIVVSVLSQLVGMMGFAVLLAGFTGQFSFSVDLVMARLVCTTWFALIGSMGALLIIGSAAFGGFSGIFQTKSVLKNAGLSIRHYMLWKMLHSALSCLIFYVSLCR